MPFASPRRSYEFVIEETIPDTSPKVHRTSKERIPQPATNAAVQATHEIFQQGVGFYTLALARLGAAHVNGKTAPNNLWDAHLADSPEVRILVKKLRGYAALNLGNSDDPVCWLDSCFMKAAGANVLLSEMKLAETYRWAADAAIKISKPGHVQSGKKSQKKSTNKPELSTKRLNDLKSWANTWVAHFSKRDGDNCVPGSGVYDELHRQLHGLDSSNDCDLTEAREIIRCRIEAQKSAARLAEKHRFTEIHQQIKKTNINTNTEQDDGETEALAKKQAAKETLAQQSKFRAKISQAFSSPGTFIQNLTAFATDLNLLANEANQIPVGNERLSRLQEPGKKDQHKLTLPLLRYVFLRNETWSDVALKDVIAAAKNSKPKQKLGDLQPWQVTAGIPLLPAFFSDAVKGIIDQGQETIWQAFDSAALKRAAEDVFKFQIRTEQRQSLVSKLADELTLMDGKGRNSTDDDSILYGFEDDPRKTLLVELLKELAELRGGGLEGYGLRRSTLGGWDQVRSAFRSAVANNPCISTADLIEKVEDMRRKVSSAFGSADLYYKLAEVNFRNIWAEPEKPLSAWHADDVVEAYCTYVEKLERLGRIADFNGAQWVPKPINYKLPGSGKSYRPYDFECALTKHPKLRLWHRDKTADPHAKIVEANDADAFILTLSGRRMKRDRLLNDAGESQQSGYLPPMAAALADPIAPLETMLPVDLTSKHKTDQLNANLRLLAMVRPKVSEVPEELREKLINQLRLPHIDDPATVSTWDWILRSEENVIRDALSATRKERFTLLPPRHDRDAFHFTVAFEVSQAELDAIRVPPLHGKPFSRWVRQGQGFAGAFMAWPVDLRTKGGNPELDDTETPVEISDDDQNAPPPKTKLKPNELWCRNATVDASVYALGVDLGVRATASVMRGEAKRFDSKNNIPNGWRSLAPEGETAWALRFLDHSKLRLAGEDLVHWHKSKGGTFALQQELYGSRGRPATPAEYQMFCRLAKTLIGEAELEIPAPEKEGGRFIPIMADHLVFRLERRLGRIRRLFRLRWRLVGQAVDRKGSSLIPRNRSLEESTEEHVRVLEELLGKDTSATEPSRADSANRSKEAETWLEPLRRILGQIVLPTGEARTANLEATAQRIEDAVWKRLGDMTGQVLHELLEPITSSDGLIEQVATWTWPLRDKQWKWTAYVPTGDLLGSLNRADHHPAINQTTPQKSKIAGQRGLSMPRIELLQRLRRCCQSIVKIERRWRRGLDGINPEIMSDVARNHEPCPAVLEKVDQLREQRVFQTAHLIVAEALGLELADPSTVELDGMRKPELKTIRDLHGWYRLKKIKIDGTETDAPRCSVIVLENLIRYRTSSDRARFENRQLMEWSHRAVAAKVVEMASIFGIRVVCVDARFSSRYDARTGFPGVRVARVRKGFELLNPWSRWIAEKRKSADPTARAEGLQAIKQRLDHSDGKLELIAECDGGPLFMSIEGSVFDADVNAAGNILLRAFAHPDLLHFTPAIWSEIKTAGQYTLLPTRGALAEREIENRTVRIGGNQSAGLATTKQPRKKNTSRASDSTVPPTTEETRQKSGKKEMLFVFGPPGTDGSWLGFDKRAEIELAGSKFTVAPYGSFWGAVEGRVRKKIESENERLK